jgi:hypothetical protein
VQTLRTVRLNEGRTSTFQRGACAKVFDKFVRRPRREGFDTVNFDTICVADYDVQPVDSIEAELPERHVCCEECTVRPTPKEHNNSGSDFKRGRARNDDSVSICKSAELSDADCFSRRPFKDIVSPKNVVRENHSIGRFSSLRRDDQTGDDDVSAIKHLALVRRG